MVHCPDPDSPKHYPQFWGAEHFSRTFSNNSIMKRRAHIVAHGHVQGVWFRAAVKDVAGLEGISGFVRNLPGGGVEAVFEGDSTAVEAVINFCRHGPTGSRVDRVDLAEEEYTGGFDAFTIRY
jgi:acylphosphatase